MREILFRGKCIQGKEWVYGYFFAKPILEKYFIELGNEMWQVDPATVGQYTGLQDKNGNKIFEGDIVKNDIYLGVVNFSIGCYCVQTKVNNPSIEIIGFNNLEVIGNIHDNPELLEVK